MKKAVILLSGGLDSATVLAIAKADGFDCYAISFDYQQRGVDIELNAARQVCEAVGVSEHKIFTVNTGQFGGSALTDTNIAVPTEELTTESKEIPVTYVPARNTVFLSIALGWAEVIGAYDIFIGANIIDYSNYPDCRPEYLETFEKLANLATKAGTEGQNFKIHAPLLYLSKPEIIQRGLALNLDYRITVSCYQPDTKGRACGQCESCQIRAQAFKDSNISDPTFYVA